MQGGIRSRTCVVLGADTRLGQRMCAHLACQQKHQVIPVTQDRMSSNPTKFIHEFFAAQRLGVVINCMADPDSGFMPPSDPFTSLIAPTQAAVQQCASQGAIYIHVSHSRVFGQNARPCSDRDYGEYDPTYYRGDDLWPRILIDLESIPLRMAYASPPRRMRDEDQRFRMLLLRMPHLLHPFDHEIRTPERITLDLAVRMSATSERSFAVPARYLRIGVLSTDVAARAIFDAIYSPQRLITGIYHVSSEPVLVDQVMRHVAIRSGRFVNLEDRADSESPMIAGLERHQAMRCNLWIRRGLKIHGSWKSAIDDMLVRFGNRRQLNAKQTKNLAK